MRFSEGQQTISGNNRVLDYEDWHIDGSAESGDCQYPTAIDQNGQVIDNDRAFRIDAVGADTATVDQIYHRGDFREYYQWHDGSSWVRCNEYLERYVNITGDLPTCSEGTPSNQGSGFTSYDVPNDQPTAYAGEKQTVNTNATVVLHGEESDDNNCDLLTYKWTQIGGTTVTLIPSDIYDTPHFTAPGAATDITFKLEVEDGTQTQHEYAPTNSKSDPDMVEIEVK